jgi:hypothetical protein
MHSSPYLPARTAADPSYVLRTVRRCGPYAAHRLSAAERYEAAEAANARARLLRESGAEPAGFAARPTRLRSAIGAALIRIGEYVQSGTPAAATAGRG